MYRPGPPAHLVRHLRRRKGRPISARCHAGLRLARDLLRRRGIPLILEPAPPRTWLDGALLRDGDSLIVAMTLRHDRLDRFWLTLLHELAHASLHLRLRPPLHAFLDDLDSAVAETLGIHPALLAARVQEDRHNYRILRGLLMGEGVRRLFPRDARHGNGQHGHTLHSRF
ncbi:MAG: hypothetical protein EYC70_05280 [Planctomycetota bacterium]|nr:MAG: hypothetical protein EYC70_05280 [Planctomycetota bacterium]